MLKFMSEAVSEIQEGGRFAFGDNWQRFLASLTQEKIDLARTSLTDWLGDISGKTFIDIGSGSGLSSLAAHQLGARVTSFDYDPQSVACTLELRHRYASDDPCWKVTTGSALDDVFLASLGHFDIAYSWGVLHHTGDLWAALKKVPRLVVNDGIVFISIYNDQGAASRQWVKVKRRFNSSGPVGRAALIVGVDAYFHVRRAPSVLRSLMLLRLPQREQARARGMDRRHDLVDWVGGYPFEVARPEEVFDLFREEGFILERLKTCGGGLGCNEYRFTRAST